MDGLQGKIQLKWMIWGYPHFGKPPYYEPWNYDTSPETIPPQLDRAAYAHPILKTGRDNKGR